MALSENKKTKGFFFTKLNRIFDSIFKASIALAATCIAGICLLILLQIVGRWFNLQVPSAEDFSGYLLAASLFFALAYSYQHNSHIRVLIILGRFGESKRFWLEKVNLTILLLLIGFCTQAAIISCYESFEYNDKSAGHIAIPLWIPKLPMVVGMILFWVAIIKDWLSVMVKRNEPSYLTAERNGEGGE